MNRVLLVGRIDNAEFQRNIAAANWAQSAGHVTVETVSLFEFEWSQWLMANRAKYQLWQDEIQFMVAINDDADTDYQQFYSFCEEKYKYEESDDPDFQNIAKMARLNRMKSSKRDYCHITLARDSEALPGALVMELFTDLAPKTVENFVALCKDGYRNTHVHRIVQNGWIQMGDTGSGSKGDGGHSSFSEKYFADETFAVKHTRRGMVGMANQGPHTNQSQFYVTLEAKPYLDKKYVCFGAVIEGTAILDALEQVDTFNERPTKPISIVDCGRVVEHEIE